jgi:hypothetical protein
VASVVHSVVARNNRRALCHTAEALSSSPPALRTNARLRNLEAATKRGAAIARFVYECLKCSAFFGKTREIHVFSLQVGETFGCRYRCRLLDAAAQVSATF